MLPARWISTLLQYYHYIIILLSQNNNHDSVIVRGLTLLLTETYSAVETKSFSSPPDSSSCSRVRDSPVDWSPITTHYNNQLTSLNTNSCCTHSQLTTQMKIQSAMSIKPTKMALQNWLTTSNLHVCGIWTCQKHS